jgi:hypothetical protein
MSVIDLFPSHPCRFNGPTTLIPVPLITMTGQCNYPKVAIIPGSGDLFIFQNLWAIHSATTGLQIQASNWGSITGQHTGYYSAGNALIPMVATETIADMPCEMVLFGGGTHEFYNDANIREDALDTTLRITITGNNHVFTTDDPMPYARVQSDAIVQPNGMILIFNGGRYGRSGGAIGGPDLIGTASEVFCYDPSKPRGQRWRVFAKAQRRRFYHANALLAADATTIIMGTDEATYCADANSNCNDAYDHDAERFTPPWLLDGSPRPIITSSPTGDVYLNTEFLIYYSGVAQVDKVTLMAPNANTHGTEMAQRTLHCLVVTQTANQLLVRAPIDVTVMVEGFYLLFLVTGETPSLGAWVRIINAPAGYAFPALTPFNGAIPVALVPTDAPLPPGPTSLTVFELGEQCWGSPTDGWNMFISVLCNSTQNMYCEMTQDPTENQMNRYCRVRPEGAAADNAGNKLFTPVSISKAMPGDVFDLRCKPLCEPFVTAVAGTVDNPIRIRGITGFGTTISGFTSPSPSICASILHDNYILENIILKDCTQGVVVATGLTNVKMIGVTEAPPSPTAVPTTEPSPVPTLAIPPTITPTTTPTTECTVAAYGRCGGLVNGQPYAGCTTCSQVQSSYIIIFLLVCSIS